MSEEPIQHSAVSRNNNSSMESMNDNGYQVPPLADLLSGLETAQATSRDGWYEQNRFPFNVDCMTGSRQADEKRRRNAQASSRFRERRKQKDIHNHEVLQQKDLLIRQLQHQRDYYIGERNYFRGLVAKLNPATTYIRPPSPQRLDIEDVEEYRSTGSVCH